MRKPLLAALAAASVLLAQAPAASAAAQTHAAGWCSEKQPSGRYYYKHAKHWDCVSPGAYCAKEQRGQYGYSMRAAAHAKRYKCAPYAGGAWRWKPAPA
ncbi:hypothetical protein [Nonomuraea pusilla]|uniref:Bacteriocin (Lactococcin_972) n=1 Tax=Nonomuraea pusilla TaxID=46177 RepID=A0A1H8F9K4_9ACTN|nr:hypothetical protein [Nonomuraea pusilla]SEN28245.1 hypothetical protein SAMN05660976_07200 [Nonomuraea pusilla]